MSSEDDLRPSRGPTRVRLADHARRAFDTAQPALMQWVKGGAALGVARTGAKVALTVAKRNPAIFVAAGVLGAGVLAYRFYRKRNPGNGAATDEAEVQRKDTSAAVRRRVIEGQGEVVARRRTIKTE